MLLGLWLFCNVIPCRHFFRFNFNRCICIWLTTALISRWISWYNCIYKFNFCIYKKASPLLQNNFIFYINLTYWLLCCCVNILIEFFIHQITNLFNNQNWRDNQYVKHNYEFIYLPGQAGSDIRENTFSSDISFVNSLKWTTWSENDCQNDCPSGMVNIAYTSFSER